MTRDPITNILFAIGICLGCLMFACMGAANLVVTGLYIGVTLLIYVLWQFRKIVKQREGRGRRWKIRL